MTFSHVLTAAHCICDQVNSKTKVNCLDASINQLRPGINEITVKGGSYTRAELMADAKHTWKMDYAYIMNVDFNTYDIGIIGLSEDNKNKFFDKEAIFNGLKTSKIVPLCLGKKSLGITNKVVKGAGWGDLYEEAPVEKPRKPVFSSCMTNSASPDMWRFQNCDLDQLGPNFECFKNKDPPDYKPGQEKNCQKVFDDAKNIKDKERPSQTIKDKLSVVGKIYLSDTLNKNEKFDDLNDPEVCYNPMLLSNNGWCYLKDYPEKWEAKAKGKPWTRKAWGFCSSSCNTQIQVI